MRNLLTWPRVLSLVVVAVLVVFLGVVVVRTQIGPLNDPTVGRLWDPRLTQLRATIDGSKVDYSKTYWRIIAAWITVNGSWDDVPAFAKPYQKDTLGGDHHVFGRALFRDGTVATTAGFTLSWPDGSDGRLPEADGWANLPLQAGFDPKVTSGPYKWVKFGNAETFAGAGMPFTLPWTTLQPAGGVHVSYFVVWQEWVPVEPTPTGGAPTPTATPLAPSFGKVNYWLGVGPFEVPVTLRAR